MIIATEYPGRALLCPRREKSPSQCPCKVHPLRNPLGGFSPRNHVDDPVLAGRLGAKNEQRPRQTNNLGSHLLPGNPLVPEKFQTLHRNSAVCRASRLIAPFSSPLILPPFLNMPRERVLSLFHSSPPSTRFRALLFGAIANTVYMRLWSCS
jgi:hypothetical protein